jgi:hypothetical protein
VAIYVRAWPDSNQSWASSASWGGHQSRSCRSPTFSVAVSNELELHVSLPVRPIMGSQEAYRTEIESEVMCNRKPISPLSNRQVAAGYNKRRGAGDP